MRKLKKKRKIKSVRSEFFSYMDINQLELAFINRALKKKGGTVPEFVQIGNSKRILSIQKRNLERLCRKLKKEYNEGELDGELGAILSGDKVFVFFMQG